MTKWVNVQIVPQGAMRIALVVTYHYEAVNMHELINRDSL